MASEMEIALWFRDGWGRAHTNRKPPYLQSVEEMLWHRFQLANNRVGRWIKRDMEARANREARELVKQIETDNGMRDIRTITTERSGKEK